MEGTLEGPTCLIDSDLRKQTLRPQSENVFRAKDPRIQPGYGRYCADRSSRARFRGEHIKALFPERHSASGSNA